MSRRCSPARRPDKGKRRAVGPTRHFSAWSREAESLAMTPSGYERFKIGHEADWPTARNTSWQCRLPRTRGSGPERNVSRRDNWEPTRRRRVAVGTRRLVHPAVGFIRREAPAAYAGDVPSAPRRTDSTTRVLPLPATEWPPKERRHSGPNKGTTSRSDALRGCCGRERAPATIGALSAPGGAGVGTSSHRRAHPRCCGDA